METWPRFNIFYTYILYAVLGIKYVFVKFPNNYIAFIHVVHHTPNCFGIGYGVLCANVCVCISYTHTHLPLLCCVLYFSCHSCEGKHYIGSLRLFNIIGLSNLCHSETSPSICSVDRRWCSLSPLGAHSLSLACFQLFACLRTLRIHQVMSLQ